MLPFDEAPAFSGGGTAAVGERWWTTLGDPRLNEHIDAALAENFTLVTAWQRLRAARAIARREASDLYPDLDAFGTASRTDSFGDGGDGDDDSNEDQTQLELGLEASYELDLWGRIESRVEAERLRAAATRADYQTAAISLSAEVASVWYRLVEARMELDLIQQQIETNQKILNLLKTRFAAGRISSADVLRQQQLIEATRGQAIAVRSRAAVLAHQLAVLQGRPPQAIRGRIWDAVETTTEGNAGEGKGMEGAHGAQDAQDANGTVDDVGEGRGASAQQDDMKDASAKRKAGAVMLPALPPLPATGLPSDLVQRRPDVQRALLLLKAADADLASAVSDQYPRISLSASLSTAAEYPENLFRQWLASMAGQITAPLFDAGQRRAEIERTEAVARQRLAEYGQTVLFAFQEVEDALALEKHQVERISNLESQLKLARQTYQQLRTQYLNGVIDYIAVLDVLTQEQQLQRDLLAAKLVQLEFRIALYRALAGSFETKREAAEQEQDTQAQDGQGKAAAADRPRERDDE